MSEPLVLLHGFAGSVASWDALRRSLPSRRRAVALALFGHGAVISETPADFTAEVDRLAEAITRQVEEAGSAVHLLGYSLGGRLALGLLLRHSELFSRATLVGVHPGLVDPRERWERVARDDAWARMLEDCGLEAFIDAWQDQPLFASQRRLPAETLSAQRDLRRVLDPRELAAAMRYLSLGRMPNFRAELGALRLPVHLVVGGEDLRFQALALEMLGLIPGGRLTIVPEVGHNVVLEAPAKLAALLSSESPTTWMEDGAAPARRAPP